MNQEGRFHHREHVVHNTLNNNNYKKQAMVATPFSTESVWNNPLQGFITAVAGAMMMPYIFQRSETLSDQQGMHEEVVDSSTVYAENAPNYAITSRRHPQSHVKHPQSHVKPLERLNSFVRQSNENNSATHTTGSVPAPNNNNIDGSSISSSLSLNGNHDGPLYTFTPDITKITKSVVDKKFFNVSLHDLKMKLITGDEVNGGFDRYALTFDSVVNVAPRTITIHGNIRVPNIVMKIRQIPRIVYDTEKIPVIDGTKDVPVSFNVDVSAATLNTPHRVNIRGLLDRKHGEEDVSRGDSSVPQPIGQLCVPLVRCGPC